MKVLLTGARGYLGERIHNALALDPRFSFRLATRHPPSHGASEMVTVGAFDGASEPLLVAACEGVDAIVHLAALNEVESEADPVHAVDVNVAGTVRLLSAARKAGVRRFVYMSTAHVYGAPLVGTIDESKATRPHHPYAITHRAAEDFVLAASAEMLPIVLRLSNAIGAPSNPETPRWTLLVNDLCKQFATTGQMVLRSSGLQPRNFIAMSDVSRAIGHVLVAGAATLGDGLFNLGGPQSLRVVEMAERIASRAELVTGRRPRIVRPVPIENQVAQSLDFRTEKFARTGFVCTGHLDSEVDDTIRFCLRAFPRRGSS